MGTRHLVEVVCNGQNKVAQYGQWDGYPDGQGFTILDFLRAHNMEKFRTAVEGCWFATKEIIRQHYVDAGDDPNNKSGFITTEVADRFQAEHPTLSRDVGAKILELIYDSVNGVELIDSSNFANDTTFCEYVYTINLDDCTLYCYETGKTKLFFKCSIFDLPTNADFLKRYEDWQKNR